MQPTILGSYMVGETVAKTTLGTLFKAIPLDGPCDMVLLHKVADEVAKTQEARALVLRLCKQWAAIRDLHTLNLTGTFEADGALCGTLEYRQGRLLTDILERARQEGIPISADQAVYLAERLAGAMLSLGAQNVVCGCLSPERVLVTFEGEVMLLPGIFKDLQTTPLLASPLLDPYKRYLPPQQALGKVAKGGADRFAVGALLFECLTHQPFCTGASGFDPLARLDQAKTGLGGAEALPESLCSVLRKSLLTESPEAYADMASLKADLDLLITSGEFSPTTFNIAFLMHTLFRGEEEAQSAADAAFMALDRESFRPAKPEPPRPVVPPPAAAPPAPASPAPTPARAPSSFPAQPEETPTFGIEPEPSRKGLWIGIGAAAVVLVIAVLVWMAFFRSKPAAAPDAKGQHQLAELARLKAQQEELAKKLQSSEEEKQRLQQQIEGAKTSDEKQRAQKALEETQRKLATQQEEQKRLATTVHQVAPTPAEAPPPAVVAPAPSASAPVQPSSAGAPPTSAPAAPTETVQQPPAQPPAQPASPAAAQAAPKAQAGDLVALWAVDVKPKQINELRIDVPTLAHENHVTGTIYLELQIDEKGTVTQVRVVKAIPGDYGLNEASRAAAMKLRYSPAMKDGVPVKTSLTFPVFVK